MFARRASRLTLFTVPFLLIGCESADPMAPDTGPALQTGAALSLEATGTRSRTIIDFEELALHESQSFSTYEKDGYQLAASEEPGAPTPRRMMSAARDSWIFAGSKALFLNYILGDKYVHLTRADNSSFDLSSISIAPLAAFSPEADVRLLGIRGDGSTVEQTVSVRTFAFDTFALVDFTDLVEVRIPQGGWWVDMVQFDDLVLTLNFPGTREACHDDFSAFGFRNVGQCIRAVMTGQDDRGR